MPIIYIIILYCATYISWGRGRGGIFKSVLHRCKNNSCGCCFVVQSKKIKWPDTLIVVPWHNILYKVPHLASAVGVLHESSRVAHADVRDDDRPHYNRCVTSRLNASLFVHLRCVVSTLSTIFWHDSSPTVPFKCQPVSSCVTVEHYGIIFGWTTPTQSKVLLCLYR